MHHLLKQHTLKYKKERLCCLCHVDLIPSRQVVIDVVDAEDVVDVILNHLALIDVDVVEEDAVIASVISFFRFFGR